MRACFISLAENLGVTQQTVNTWISDIRARQKASRNTVILHLSHLARLLSCPPSLWRIGGDGRRK